MPHPPNRLNRLRVVRHETKEFLVKVFDQDGRVIKPTGSFKAHMTVKASAGSADALISKSVGHGIEAAEEDRWHVTLETTETGALAAGTYKWDFWIEDASKSPAVRKPVVKAADFEVVNGITSFPVVVSGA